MNRLLVIATFASLLLAASPASAESYWGAIAYFIQGNQAFLTGVTDKPNKAEAERAAIAACEKQAPGSCEVGTVFANGACGYGAWGGAPPGLRGVAVGWGSSPQNAVQECSRQGGVCTNTPIGFCTKKGS
jgi:hypothetical protein